MWPGSEVFTVPKTIHITEQETPEKTNPRCAYFSINEMQSAASMLAKNFFPQEGLHTVLVVGGNKDTLDIATRRATFPLILSHLKTTLAKEASQGKGVA